MLRDVLGDVQGESCFTHGWASGKDNKVCVLETGKDVIQRAKAGLEALVFFGGFWVVEFGNFLISLGEDFFDVDKAVS